MLDFTGVNAGLLSTFGQSVTIDDVAFTAVVQAMPSSFVAGNVIVDRPEPVAILKASDVDALGDAFELKAGQTLVDASGNEYRVTFVGRSENGLIELMMRPV